MNQIFFSKAGLLAFGRADERRVSLKAIPYAALQKNAQAALLQISRLARPPVWLLNSFFRLFHNTAKFSAGKNHFRHFVLFGTQNSAAPAKSLCHCF